MSIILKLGSLKHKKNWVVFSFSHLQEIHVSSGWKLLQNFDIEKAKHFNFSSKHLNLERVSAQLTCQTFAVLLRKSIVLSSIRKKKRKKKERY